MWPPGNVAGLTAPRSVRPDPTDGAPLWELLDDLLESEAPLEHVLAAASAALGGRVGVLLPDGRSLALGEHGSLRHAPAPADASSYRLPDGTATWVQSPSGPVGDGTLRHLALVARAALTSRTPPVTTVAGQLATLVDLRADPMSRERALRYLHLRADSPVTAVLLVGDEKCAGRVCEGLRERSDLVRHGVVDGIHLCLVHGEVDLEGLDVPTGLRSSISATRPAREAPTAWSEARLALRFALPSRHDHGPYAAREAVLVRSEHLGGYALLASRLNPDDILQVPDVQHLGVLCRELGDTEMLDILEAVAATDSLRKAAQAVHMHHNTVARRVERAEQVLGFPLTEPYGRTRLFLALVLRRLYGSRDLG